MNLLNWLFGKRIKLHEDGTFNVLQDEDKKEKMLRLRMIKT